MTEKKQITIYDLLPLLKPGYVAYDIDGWIWSKDEFLWDLERNCWVSGGTSGYNVISDMFDIAPFDDDWKDSLMEVK